MLSTTQANTSLMLPDTLSSPERDLDISRMFHNVEAPPPTPCAAAPGCRPQCRRVTELLFQKENHLQVRAPAAAQVTNDGTALRGLLQRQAPPPTHTCRGAPRPRCALE